MTLRLLIAALMVTLPTHARAQTPTKSAGTPTKTAGTTPLVIGETFTIQSKVLNEARRINVWAPPEYADSAALRLPVMYMPDGGIAEDFLHVAGLMQVSIGNGTMRPFLLVGIENTERRRDMTGPTADPEDRKIAKRVGGSAEFRNFIRTELMPAVKSRYRTTGETAIVGESLAGLFVTETLFLQPDMFDTYIAIDPSLWWNRETMVHDAASYLAKLGSQPKTLYLTNSGDGSPEVMDSLAMTLKARAPSTLTWYHEPLPTEKHSTIYHPAALQAFRKLFKPADPSK
jgi:predicted alpha/beta superfamily hydrolase